LVKFKDDATDEQVQKISDATEKAFGDAYESDETEEEKANAEGKSDGAKKASAGGKKKKAAAATAN
jgi:hypothetical protein